MVARAPRHRIENNFGAVFGNVLLGFMHGSAGAFGVILGRKLGEELGVVGATEEGRWEVGPRCIQP